MSDIVSFKCPNCGSPLKYNTEAERFRCEFCDSEFDLDQIKNAAANEEQEFDWGEYNANVTEEKLDGTVSYVCKSCGAEIITDAVTAATHCPYCGNVVMIEPNLTGPIKPNGVIPFKVDKKKLADTVKAYCKGKRLLPKDFLSTHTIEKVQGLYVPFWLYSCKTDGSMTFDATRVRSWSDSQYIYTETSYYLLTCDGEMSFAKIPADGSLKMDDALMDSIEPYDYKDLKEFAEGYLSGFVAERFDEDAESTLPRATKRVRQSMADAFRSSIAGFTTVTPVADNVKLSDTSVQYVLLPVYLISAEYKGVKYRFAVNGQTGKMTGNLPISKAKYWLYLLGFIAAFAAATMATFIL